MLRHSLAAFREIWFCDFEFTPVKGGRSKLICMVAREWRSGRELRLDRNQLHALEKAPFSVGRDCLFVAYAATAELTCFLALGWCLPEHVLDLFVEYRAHSNILSAGGRAQAGLLTALRHFGLNTIDDEHKKAMQELAIGGGPFTEDQMRALIDYCAQDVDALARLFGAMSGTIDLPRALLRGRYVATSARMEDRGIPIDVDMLDRLKRHWLEIKRRLIDWLNPECKVFDKGVFKQQLFESYLQRNGLADFWPRTPHGLASHDKDELRDMAMAHPRVAELCTLLHILGQMREIDVSVGDDGRSRSSLWPFGALTSRNAPRGSVFGLAAFMRSLITPSTGMALAYLDFEQQEWAIAASLSRDRAMSAAYVSGDPYLQFAVQSGAAPRDATKVTHGATREQFKQAALAVQYSQQAEGLARRLACPKAKARHLLELHRHTYAAFWQWSDAYVDDAFIHGRVQTVFGWPMRVDETGNDRSVRNFAMQAHGAEMLRIACIFGEERGVRLLMPVHDAVLIEAPDAEIGEASRVMAQAMEDASEIVLDDPVLRVRAEITPPIRSGERYRDKRGVVMWAKVQRALTEIEASAGAPSMLHARSPAPSLSSSQGSQHE